ncbi:hypothetical protein SFRURICE_000619, partial [Spodoptera frugiperda]
RHDCASDYVIPPPASGTRGGPSFLRWGRAGSLAHSFGIRHSQTLLLTAYRTEKSRYENRHSSEEQNRPLTSSRLPAIEELTLGLKQKLHLQARARAAPYYIRKQEPVDLVERLLEQRALVAEAVRRLQEKKQPCHEISVDS